ncbi:MAG: hypothetical protein ACRC2H_01145 [Silanimonas sp.]
MSDEQLKADLRLLEPCVPYDPRKREAFKRLRARLEALSTIEADEVLVAIKRPSEDYDDVHPDLVAEDAFREHLGGGSPFSWRVVAIKGETK